MIKIALERIYILRDLAVKVATPDPQHSRRYIRIAEAIGRRMDITLPRGIKRSYCKKCKLPYGENTRIRLRRKTLFVHCGNCGNIRRIPYK